MSCKPVNSGVRKRTNAIALLNDDLRENIVNAGQRGRVLLTRGVTALDPVDQLRLIKEVKLFNDFSKDNDPHGEHDFGSVTLNGVTYFWKIDYYDAKLEYGSEDPTDPEVTTRVLTIMRADEY